ncbi:MAG: hypothetical protein IJW49_01985 [Clostridia bacterium]|nr:hypothetical protein [Clostridia bacterium]
MKDYGLLGLAAILLAVDFALSKLYQKRAGATLSAGFAFNALSGLFTALIFWAIGGFQLEFSLYSAIMACLLSALGIAYTLFGFRILKSGSMALYSLFLMVGGMTLPYIWGLLFLNEPFSWLRTAGLVVLILAVLLSNLPKKGERLNAKLFLMCLAVFVLNGLVSVVSKTHQVQLDFAAVSASQFVAFSGVAKLVLAGTAFLITRKIDRQQSANAPRAKLPFVLGIVATSAAVGGISYLFQLIGAENLPATVLYPFITGGSMIFSSIVGMIVFREKPSRALLFSIGLCFVGTLIFL